MKALKSNVCMIFLNLWNTHISAVEFVLAYIGKQENSYYLCIGIYACCATKHKDVYIVRHALLIQFTQHVFRNCQSSQRHLKIPNQRHVFQIYNHPTPSFVKGSSESTNRERSASVFITFKVKTNIHINASSQVIYYSGNIIFIFWIKYAQHTKNTLQMQRVFQYTRGGRIYSKTKISENYREFKGKISSKLLHTYSHCNIVEHNRMVLIT